MAGIGQKTKYTPDVPKLAGWMARSGLTDVEIATELGIHTATLYRWKAKYPELQKALEQNKNIIDAMVEDSLLKRAMGYDYEETEIVAGKEGKTQRVRKTKKHVIADTTAAIFWLKNRQPTHWRDRHEIEHSGNISHEPDMAELTADELRELIKIEAADQPAEE